jgi:hypothetical protein
VEPAGLPVRRKSGSELVRGRSDQSSPVRVGVGGDGAASSGAGGCGDVRWAWFAGCGFVCVCGALRCTVDLLGISLCISILTCIVVRLLVVLQA